MARLARIAETLGGHRVLGKRTASADGLRAGVQVGLPYASLEALATRFEIARADLVRLLHLPRRTFARRKKARRLSPSESDRLLRLGRLATLAEQTLGSREKATRWLHQPNRALGGSTPLHLLDTDLGARQVEDVLLRIAHGVYS